MGATNGNDDAAREEEQILLKKKERNEEMKKWNGANAANVEMEKKKRGTNGHFTIGSRMVVFLLKDNAWMLWKKDSNQSLNQRYIQTKSSFVDRSNHLFSLIKETIFYSKTCKDKEQRLASVKKLSRLTLD